MSEPNAKLDSGLDVILQADAIRPPLTGIGRYATQLARGLQVHDAVSRLRFFGLTSWIDDPLGNLTNISPTAGSKLASDQELPRSWKSVLRAHLANSRLVVRAYGRIGPPLAGWRLRHESGSVYHSPNFLLPAVSSPAVVTIHDLSHEMYPQFHPAARVEYMRRAMPDVLRRATHLITDAESVRQEIISCYGWPVDRITAVPLGVDATFHPRNVSALSPWLTSLGLFPNGYCLFVGTVEPRKNLDSLLSAYSRLPTALRMQFPLVIAGGGGWRSHATHERIRLAVSQGWAHYLSFVPQAKLPLLYAGARVFAFPSYYEGFGLPVLEAMASGVPVLTSNVSSLPEVVGGAGRLTDPSDVDAITRELNHLLCDQKLRSDLSELALKRSLQFTWSSCVNATVDVYQRTRSSA